jgi:hypothetical protein
MEKSVRDLMEEEAKRGLTALAATDPTTETYQKAVAPVLKICQACLDEDERDIQRGHDRKHDALAERKFEHEAAIDLRKITLQEKDTTEKNNREFARDNFDQMIRTRELTLKEEQATFTNRFGETELLYKRKHDRAATATQIFTATADILKYGAGLLLAFGCWAASVTYEEEAVVHSPTVKNLGNTILNHFRPK